MLLRGDVGSSSITCSLRDVSLTIGVDERLVAAWDRAGRLYSLWKDGVLCRRGLNGRIVAKGRREDQRAAELLDGTHADAAVDEAAALARLVLDALDAKRLKWADEPRPALAADLAEALTAAARFTGGAARADAARFAEVYSPIGILPPDQYLALVLQATVGCSFNTCAFCNLYRDPFRIKGPAEFREHIARVREYLGRSIGLRGRSIFLGSANALAVPMAHLLPLFEVMASEPGVAGKGVFAFLDAFSGARKDAADYRRLAALGLRRVYVGLESGHDALLAFVNKPGAVADAIETVHALTAAGVHVAVIVMIGLGGDRLAEAHAADTAVALNSMKLGAGDLIYFSDLVEAPGTAYPRLAADRSIRPLTGAELGEQRRAIRDRLVFEGRPPQIAAYDIREFVY
jgi:hypothetical protein